MTHTFPPTNLNAMSKPRGKERPEPAAAPQIGGPENIGARVRRLRTEKGMSQDRLALEAHMDQSGLSKFERGGRGVGEVPLRRIAASLRLTYEELIEGSDFRTGQSEP